MKQQDGYALLDVVLALAVFSISITPMVVLLQKIVDTSGGYAHDRIVQRSLDSFLTETKRKPVSEMNSEYYDEALAVTFRSEVEPWEMANVDGENLDDLYKLIVTAEYEDDDGPRSERVELYIYQPEQR